MSPNFVTEIKELQEKIRSLFPETPLEKSKLLSERYGAEIYLKREDLTPVRSYKIRGAFSFFSENAEKDQEFVCASAGNHSQGFAFCCARFGKKGKVFMPLTTPSQKVEKTKIFGGPQIEIVLTGDTFDEAAQTAEEYCKSKGGLWVPPFAHELIIRGQATVASEIHDKFIPDALVLPVGGGGLSAGVTEFFHQTNPETEIFCAEPLGAPSLKTSLEKGVNTTLEKVDTFVDGAAVGRMGSVNFEYLKKYIKNPVILCPEDRICGTILEFLNSEGIILEPAGALAIDALADIFADKNQAQKLKGKKIVCITSGGNLDFGRLPEIKERWEQYHGKKRYIILHLPQRPGALREFLDILGPDDDIARFEYFKKSSRTFGAVLVGISTKNPENFTSLFQRLKDANFTYEDLSHNEILSDFLL